MPVPDLSVDDVLTTTRAVRRRLDLTRPVDPAIIRECLELAVQAPSPGNMQGWHFVVVTDRAQRRALAELYRRSARLPGGQDDILDALVAGALDEAARRTLARQARLARHLTGHLQDVPVHVIPCFEGRTEDMSRLEQVSTWAGIWPAAWSFMLAARSRGLGTTLTTLHLEFEREAAEALGLPYERVTQAGLIAVGHVTGGTAFGRGGRKPLDEVVHWDRW